METTKIRNILMRSGYVPEGGYPLGQLNAIEILWRFMKYEWIEIEAYSSWKSLIKYVEKVLRLFDDRYVINFA